jgi:hypothetical protein
VLDKVSHLLSGMPEIVEQRRIARSWYEKDHQIGDPLKMGRASSAAGVSAGQGASFHRGEFGAGQRQRQLR